MYIEQCKIKVVRDQMRHSDASLHAKTEWAIQQSSSISRIAITVFFVSIAIAYLFKSYMQEFDASKLDAITGAKLQGFFMVGIAVFAMLYFTELYICLATESKVKKNMWMMSSIVKLVCLIHFTCSFLYVRFPEYSILLPPVFVDFVGKPLFVSQYAEWISGSVILLLMAHEISDTGYSMYTSACLQTVVISSGMMILIPLTSI